MDQLRVLFFGDSICVGQFVSIHKTWVSQISSKLENFAKSYNKNLLVINASVNGNTTRQALERMPYDVQSHKPDIAVIQFGINDSNCWQTDLGNPRVSPKAFNANLEEIITRCFTFGAKSIFLNTNHPSGRDFEPLPFKKIAYQENNKLYNTIIREVAQNNPQIILNDVEFIFEEYTKQNREQLLSLLLPDLIHLSEKGHNIYYDYICPKIENEIKQLITV